MTTKTSETGQQATHSNRGRVAKVITAGLTVLAVAGVALAGLPAWATGPTPDLPQKNVDAWVMPLDRFISVSTVVSDYVENRRTIPCMAAAGYAWDVPKRDIEAASNRAGDVTVERPLTAAVAQQRGFHPAPTDDPGLLPTRQLSLRSISKAEDNALVACLQKLRKAIPWPTWQQDLASQDAVALGNAAYKAALTDGAVVSAARKWQECMGASDRMPLADSPAQMPSPQVADLFGVNLQGSTVSQAERDLALKDVGCQSSSGYRNALYEAEWNRQAFVPKRDADLFKQVGDANENYRATELAALAKIQLAGG